jgi:exonuclease III
MKIVTYNLRYGGKKGDGNHWERIMDEFSPDLVLAQETFNPREYFSTKSSHTFSSVVWASVPAEWGSAILSVRHKLTPILVPGFEGWVVGGSIDEFIIGGVSKPLFVFSIHAPTQSRDEKKVPYEKKVQEILDRIHEIAFGAEVLIGGDFNIDAAIRHSDEKLKTEPSELAVIDRLRTEFGLINAWQALHPNANLPQTLRWSKDKSKPYHCDGIFIPHSWLKYLESCEVVSEGWSEMSDHNPIVATINVQPGRCT